MLNKLY